MYDLLKKNGRIIGVIFNRNFEKVGPPFGGTIAEYKRGFKERFDIVKMEKCYNSIPARNGTEVSINLKKIDVV